MSNYPYYTDPRLTSQPPHPYQQQQQQQQPVYDAYAQQQQQHQPLPHYAQQPAYSRPPPSAPQYQQPPQQHHPQFAAPHQPIPADPYGSPYSAYAAPSAPSRPLGRHVTTRRRVELTKGNLVVDVPVPERVLQTAVYKQGNEFTHLRYTACTADPNDFQKEEFALRQQIYNRETEIFVVMTMYNEDDALFTRTFHAVMKNIAHLCSRNRSRIWGSDGWKKVVVCVVADGRSKIHPRVLSVLGALGVYQEGIAKNSFNGKPVTAHLYEYTTQLTVDNDLRLRGSSEGIVPCQVLFCLKEKNAKKINSHRWFFNAFGQVLRPNVCVLLDVGTKPSNTSIYHLWKAFDRDPQVAGACGEICADLGKGGSLLLNPLVATQNFEYKMSNILDKPMESVFGYISVLPGAFSAYRFQALQNTGPEQGPLYSYFKGEAMHGAGANSGVFEANMYLAEDRILCFELVAKRNCNYVLKYVKSAKAWTDVPDSVPEFISQRRRWLNGSFFASFYSIIHFGHLFRTSHSVFRLAMLMIEFLYNTIQMLFSWFALANFYLTFYFLIVAYSKQNEHLDPNKDPFHGSGDIVFNVFRQLYLASIITLVVISLGNRPAGSRWLYTLSMILFSLIMLIMLYSAGFTVYLSLPKTSDEWKTVGNKIVQVPTFRNIVISLASTYGLYFVSSILHLDPWHMITSFVQYLLLMPSFVNVLMIYAFCNTHDVSWGTKGDNTMNNDLGHAKVGTGKDGKQTVEFEMPTEEADINAAYDRLLAELKTRPKEEKKHRDAATKREDSMRNFRTNLVLVWLFTNAALVIVFTNDFMSFLSFRQVKPGADFNPYLTFIFWAVAGLSAFRFVGSSLYLVLRMIFG